METLVDYRKDMLVIRQREAFEFLANAIERCRQEGISASDILGFVLENIPGAFVIPNDVDLKDFGNSK